MQTNHQCLVQLETTRFTAERQVTILLRLRMGVNENVVCMWSSAAVPWQPWVPNAAAMKMCQ
jgi:hypothetical protein